MLSVVGALVLLAALGFPAAAGPWPTTSAEPVRACTMPTLQERIGQLGIDPSAGFRFVAFGDQRALADGEWQEMMRRISSGASSSSPILFMVDTGDIVADGRHTDQFSFLETILAPTRDLPYLACVGNHEVRNNESWPARVHTATYLQPLDPDLSPARLYYRKDVGPLCLLFLDSNDLVYGPCRDPSNPGSSEGGSVAQTRQIEWLRTQLRQIDRTAIKSIVIVMHHPLLQSSTEHVSQAAELWNRRFDGQTLADLFADAGVDLVLTGHTHTYERFAARRTDGRGFAVVNLSGRPRNSFLWFGAASRRARDIGGREARWLREHGWHGLDHWTVRQEAAMTGSEADQFGSFDVGPDGSLTMQVRYLDPTTPEGVRAGDPVRLK